MVQADRYRVSDLSGMTAVTVALWWVMV